MEIGDPIIVLFDIAPDLPRMLMVAVEGPVDKFDLRHLFIQKILQLFFDKANVPQPHFFVNG